MSKEELELFGAIGIALLTFVEGWAEFMQGRKIWKSKSGEKIPVIAYTIDLGAFLATIVYGIGLSSVAYIWNGIVMSIMFIYILSGLWKFKEITARDKMFTVFVAGVIISMSLFVNDKIILSTIMSVFLGITTLSEALKLRELATGPGVGAVEIRTNNTWLVTNSLFVIYSWSISDWVFFSFCVPIVIIQVCIAVVYYSKVGVEEQD